MNSPLVNRLENANRSGGSSTFADDRLAANREREGIYFVTRARRVVPRARKSARPRGPRSDLGNAEINYSSRINNIILLPVHRLFTGY